MNEQQARDLVDRFAAGVARHRDAAKRCTYPDAALVNDGWAAGLEEAAVELVVLLDGRDAAAALRERLSGGPVRNVEAAQQVRHLSEKAPNANVSAAGGAR
ncbi:hypothetical protein AB0B07_33295 [Streptomyces sioyaensis]|uniref:hypothetical protein n=1 Tax=Streptomyces sioyaensis TaxID=67364 RepID=UPI0033E64EA8